MPPRYADRTDVPIARSKAEIETLLASYGADQFFSAWDARAATIGFRVDGRQVKIRLPLPDRKARDITHTETGKERAPGAQQVVYDQACRSSWRALCLVIKAKLEAIAAGISTIEREFLADVVLPDGRTIGQWAEPQLTQIYLSGQMPKLLPGGTE
jgi:hypothetical protein